MSDDAWDILQQAQDAYDEMPRVIDDETGDQYCAECYSLLAGGPHSPNPHRDDCKWAALWDACKEADDALPDTW